MNRRNFIVAACVFGAARAGAAASLPSAAEQLMPVTPPRPIGRLIMRDDAGRDVPLAAFRGQVIVLNLWAPWCLPCREEMPALSRLQVKLAVQGGVVLPLSFDWRGAEGVKQFYAATHITNLSVLVGDAPNLQAATGMVGLPSTLIIAPTGEHVGTVIGAANWDDEATLNYLLGLRN